MGECTYARLTIHAFIELQVPYRTMDGEIERGAIDDTPSIRPDMGADYIEAYPPFEVGAPKRRSQSTLQPGETTTLATFLRQARRRRGRPAVDHFIPASRPTLMVDYSRGELARREYLELLEEGRTLSGGYFILGYDDPGEEAIERIAAIIAPGSRAKDITGRVDMSR